MYPLNNNMIRLPDGRIVTMEEAQRLRNMPINDVVNRLPATMANPVGGPEKIGISPAPVNAAPAPFKRRGEHPLYGANPEDMPAPALSALDYPSSAQIPATPPQQPKEMGLLDRLKAGFSGIDSNDALTALGSAMLGMSQDPNLQKLGMSGFGQIQERTKGNRTLEFLKAKGVDEETLNALKNNPQMINAYAASLLKAPKTNALIDQYELAKTQGYKGSFMDYQLELKKAGATNVSNVMEGANEDFWKEFRKGEAQAINTMADRAPELVQSLNQIQMLQRLGQGLDANTAIPTWARPYVPEGVSSALDAYNSLSYSVAQGLRVAGTGPMTDKDFDVLVKRAGSSALSPEARAIVQTGLQAAVQMNLDLARAAQEFRSNPSDESRAAYQKKVDEILSRRLFTDEQQAMLDSYAGERMPIKPEAVHGLDIPSGFLQGLTAEDYEILRSGVMSKEDIEQAIREWRQG